MLPTDGENLGARLDTHHAPETNGRMSVCRRCGSLTDGPAGTHHIPHDRQLARSSNWLVSQARLVDIARAREMRSK
jgi:hypothetical protein